MDRPSVESIPHSIRLREPWAFSNRAPTGVNLEHGPFHAIGVRRFRSPTGLANEDCVALVLERWHGSAVALNGQTLRGVTDGGGRWQCEIRARLQPINVLELEFSAASAEALAQRIAAFRRDSITPGGVRLEIHPSPSP